MICDIAVILVFVLFLVTGYKKGLIRSAYSMLSVVISVALLYFLRDAFADFIVSSQIGESIYDFFLRNYDGEIATKCAYAVTYIVSIIILYVVLRFMIKALFNVLNLIAKLPLLNFVNSMLGAVFGVLGGVLWIVIIINILNCFPQTKDFVADSEIVKTFDILTINFLGK